MNGKPLHTSQYFSFGGQVATFVTNYLGAPVSLKEILEDMGQAGATLRPRSSHDGNADGDETQFRYVMGPKIARDVAACEPHQGWGIRMIWGVAAPRFRPFFAHFPPSLARSLRLGARKPDSAKIRRKNGGKRAQNRVETGVSDPYIRMPQP